MKVSLKFVLVAVFGFASTSASATSLQSVFDSQETLTVSPVEYQGKPILESDRGKLCYSLGYKRVVTYSTEECGHSTSYFSLRLLGAGIEMHPSLCNAFSQKLTSITCAGKD